MWLLLNLRTYDGDEEEIMSAEVTHIVAEAEDSIHTRVGIWPLTYTSASPNFPCSFFFPSFSFVAAKSIDKQTAQ